MKICKYFPCTDPIGKGKTRFCADGHAEAHRREIRARHGLNTKRFCSENQKEERICIYGNCKKKLTTPRKKFCSDKHFMLAREG